MNGGKVWEKTNENGVRTRSYPDQMLG